MRAMSFRRSTPLGPLAPHHDLAELLRVDQAPRDGDGVDDVLPRRRRLGADLAGGILRVLVAQGRSQRPPSSR